MGINHAYNENTVQRNLKRKRKQILNMKNSDYQLEIFLVTLSWD